VDRHVPRGGSPWKLPEHCGKTTFPRLLKVPAHPLLSQLARLPHVVGVAVQLQPGRVSDESETDRLSVPLKLPEH
jgi:hypothetical protein